MINGGTCTIDDCAQTASTRGWCWKHYDRWRRHGDPYLIGPRGERGTRIADPLERFWSKVEKTDTCWLWTGATGTHRGGYGNFHFEGKNWLVHRHSYTLHKGPIPEGMVVDHLCGVTRCVRPDHLEVVTLAENSSRAGRSKGKPVACGKGHVLEGANVATRKDGSRYCWACASAAQQARRALTRARKAAVAYVAANPDDDASDIIRGLLGVV